MAAKQALSAAHHGNIEFLKSRGWSAEALSDRAFLNVQRMRDGAARCSRCDNPTTDPAKWCEVCKLVAGAIPGVKS